MIRPYIRKNCVKYRFFLEESYIEGVLLSKVKDRKRKEKTSFTVINPGNN